MCLLLHKQLLVPLIIILWFCSDTCCISSQEHLLNNILDENNQAYPTYLRYIADHAPSLIEYEPEIYGAEEFDQADSPQPSPAAVSVEDFGAKGDGVTDDTEAFEEAWKEVCSSDGSVLVIPEEKSFFLKPIIFKGPCKSELTVQIYGTLQASDNRKDYKKDRRHWLLFEKIDNLTVEGGGTIDGKGEIWWNNSCKINKTLPCTHAPTAITFYECNDLKVRNIRIKNSQQMHLAFQKCVDVQATSLMVTAPGKSPNTDGIHVTNTQNIQIMNCVIRTGDDCISIVDGAENVQATDITCGPGHGISIGSLGADKSEDHVTDVTVDRARLVGTTNGVRIKTWQGGKGNATNIVFQNIFMQNVTNPIIIDQNYCDQKGPCKQQKSAVQVKNVVYRNIKGTSASKVAIKFDCSENHPCESILLQDVELEGEEEEDDEKTDKVTALCKNVKWSRHGTVRPACP
ncbi:hypothetical protein ACHQM5_012697 [Ranunculus cassubicifolius]